MGGKFVRCFILALSILTIGCDKPLYEVAPDSIFYKQNHTTDLMRSVEAICFSNSVKPYVLNQDFSVTTGFDDIEIVSEQDGLLEINGPRLRSVGTSSVNSAGVLFQYLGVSEEQHPFASGTLRTQVALRILYENSCNTYYVIWIQAPEERLVVSRKHNEGDVSSMDCGADGYETIYESALSSSFSGFDAANDRLFHTLFAKVTSINEHEHELIVCCDGQSIARIPVRENSYNLPELSGLRTDNGIFRFIPFGGED